MEVGVIVAGNNAQDWERVMAGDAVQSSRRPPARGARPSRFAP